jgi:protein-S-isoprenylcysteine O-methyltransferase Ste14
MRSILPLAAAVLTALGAIALIRHGTSSEVWLVGGALMLLGLALLLLARRHLGEAFAVTPQAKVLVTRGLYSRIPHPLYVFLDVALIGLIIVLRTEWLLLPWAALVGVHAYVARLESKTLERAFGDAYREYRKRTWW